MYIDDVPYRDRFGFFLEVVDFLESRGLVQQKDYILIIEPDGVELDVLQLERLKKNPDWLALEKRMRAKSWWIEPASFYSHAARLEKIWLGFQDLDHGQP